jgi:hypothetical protein
MAVSLTVTAAHAAEYRVPLMSQPPNVDGQVEPAEWPTSAGFDGFAFNGQLERRRVRACVGATDDTLYFAIRSQLPDEGELVAQVAVDTVKIGARLTRHARRLIVQLAEVAIPRDLFGQVLSRIRQLSPVPT